MQTKDNFNKLNRFVILFFLSFFTLIVSFLVRWQFLHDDDFKIQAAERRHENEVSSIRGDILARDASTLAYSDPRFDVFVYVKDLEDAEIPTETRKAYQTREEFVNKVSSILGISSQEINTKLNSGSLWVKIASKVSIDSKADLDKLTTDLNPKRKLVGLNYEFTSERIYPENELAAHTIGFLGRDLNSNDIGRFGLEQKYNGTLEPQDGYVDGETDQFGNLITLSDSVSVRAKRGSNIKTTIDKFLQEVLERKLREGTEKYQAISASGVIMDPKTGEILALANYPTFNPGKYYEVKDGNIFGNTAVTIPYEIGSIAKVYTMAGAVNELGVKPDDIVVNGHRGCVEISASTRDSKDVRELCTFDKLSQGPLSATNSFVKSDNIAFITLGNKLGKEKLHFYLSEFGVGKSSGVDLSGESFGRLPELNDPNAWHPVDMAVFSYGHGFQMTLLQATRGVAAVANHGWLMQPYIVSDVIDSDGTVKHFEPEPIERIIEDKTTAQLKIMMEELHKVNSRDGFNNLANYPVAVKSGTALIPHKDRAGYSSDVNATYVGFDSSEEARFIMAIRLESPQAVKKLSHYSVRPLWLETFNEIKDYIGIQPEQ